MSALLAVELTLVAAAGLVVVMIREPARQAVALGVFGLLLALLFFSVQAPDVALSEIVVGSVALPAMLFLAIAKIGAQGARAEERAREAEEERD